MKRSPNTEPFRNPVHRTAPAALATLGLVAALLTALALPATAQARRLPPSFEKALRPLTAVERLEMGPVDVEALRAEDAARPLAEPGPTRFAQPLEAAFTPADAGTWEHLADGSRLWRLRVASPGALSLNLGFTRFDLPEGAGLWIYSPDAGRVEGPYTREDATEAGLWTPVVLGAELVVELHLPAGSPAPDLLLGRVGHGYRFFGEPPTKQGRCQNDVVCPEANPWRNQVRAVAWYTLEGWGTCTGTLMNNTAGDLTPYFLSAEHCGITGSNAGTMVVYWNYESPTCGALSGGRLSDNQSGARFRAAHRPSDFVLVELDRRPDPSFNVYYAGWNARNTAPNGAVGIHHPNLDEKSISFSTSRLQPDGPTHWEIVWNDGTTEPGSSGSCIFDSAKRCVGTLTGGFSFCETPREPDYYGRFAVHWTGGGSRSTRLRDWLDPLGSGSLTQDGRGPGGGTGGGGGGGTGGGGGGGGTGGSCTASSTAMCLHGGRFRADVTWQTAAGDSGPGRAAAARTDDSGLFWFFNGANWEMLVKVLDGCAVNQHYWVFSAATTNVGYTLRVTDTKTGRVKTYTNPVGRASPARNDTKAFATCP